MKIFLLIVKVFLVTVAVSAKDNTCMDRIDKFTRCPPRQHGSPMSLLQCINDCLTNGHMCSLVKWDTKNKVCYKMKQQGRVTENMNCFMFFTACPKHTDFLCIKPASRHNFQPGSVVPGKLSEANCRVLCSLWYSCQGVSWNKQHNRCTVHEKQQTEYVEPAAGEVFAVKDSRCKSRCVTITLKGNSDSGQRARGRYIEHCMDLLRRPGTRYVAVDLDYKLKSCWTHNYLKHVNFPDPGEYKLAHLRRNNMCTVNRTDIRSSTHRGQYMIGHYVGQSMDQDNCFKSCMSISNCVAASHESVSEGCYLSFVFSKPTKKTDYALIIIGEDQVQDLRLSHFKKVDAEVGNSKSCSMNAISTIQCAVLCQVKGERQATAECQAFFFNSATNLCRTNQKVKIKFVRV